MSAVFPFLTTQNFTKEKDNERDLLRQGSMKRGNFFLKDDISRLQMIFVRVRAQMVYLVLSDSSENF